MNKRLLVVIGAIFLSTTLAFRAPPQELLDTIKRKELVQTVEGVLSGIIKESNFTNLEECITEGSLVDQELTQALKDFETETFEGMREGISLVAKAVKQIPELVKECKLGEHDLSKLIEMAEIFEHPYKLIFRAGRNLIVNGVEVYHIIANAVHAKRQAEYFDFGYYIGEALDVVFLNQQKQSMPPKKETLDEQAFEFLSGYFQVIGLKSSHVNSEQLYNTIDKKGSMIYGPVSGLMKKLKAKPQTIDLPIWMSLHEISHIFQDGEAYLIHNQVISGKDDLITIRQYSEVFEHAPENEQKYSLDPRIANILQIALGNYEAGLAGSVGRDIGQIAYLIYSDQHGKCSVCE